MVAPTYRIRITKTVPGTVVPLSKEGQDVYYPQIPDHKTLHRVVTDMKHPQWDYWYVSTA